MKENVDVKSSVWCSVVSHTRIHPPLNTYTHNYALTTHSDQVSTATTILPSRSRAPPPPPSPSRTQPTSHPKTGIPTTVCKAEPKPRRKKTGKSPHEAVTSGTEGRGSLFSRKRVREAGPRPSDWAVRDERTGNGWEAVEVEGARRRHRRCVGQV